MTENAAAVGSDLLDAVTLIASRAAAAVLAVQTPALTQREKPDKSPVTAADEASEALILEAFARLLPGVPVVSEEAAGRSAPTGLGTRFLVVDPLDGTRELLAGRDEFTINLALVQHGAPVLGVIAAPARGLIWRGIVGRGAERLALTPGAEPNAARERVAIHTRPRPTECARVLVSRSHLDAATAAYVDRLSQPERVPCGSALKFCLLAEGSADLYPRLSMTSEWDVAAGHALLLAAGGDATKPDGGALHYGQPGFRVPAFIAFGDHRAPPTA